MMLPTTSAERMRRLRERRREGAVVVSVEIEPEAIAELQRLGWLAPWQRSDPEAVADAVLALESRAIGIGLRPRQ